MIGKFINKYRIDAKLGEGGMGLVYKAWDTVLERPVALKMMHAGLAADFTNNSGGPQRIKLFVFSSIGLHLSVGDKKS